MMGYYILIGAIALVSWLVSNKLKSKFKFYSKVHLQNGMSGAEIAEKMLADHGIKDVKVVSTAGKLTDHYDPRNKTVNLSASVYSQRNAASAAVATHCHYIVGTSVVSKQSGRDNNTNIGNNNEASGWDPVWILFHDDYYTMAVFERRKSFYL